MSGDGIIPAIATTGVNNTSFVVNHRFPKRNLVYAQSDSNEGLLQKEIIAEGNSLG